jgi:hypothetical protein
MKLRNIKAAILLLITMAFSLNSIAAPGSSEGVPATSPTESTRNDAEMQRMMQRLDEIKAMDLEKMPRSEKRKYAKEVKKIEKRMKAIGGGFYISAGALIIIILLLILLL